MALAAAPAALIAKPDSKFGGVQIGINVPYSFRGLPGDADTVLRGPSQSSTWKNSIGFGARTSG